MSNLSKGLRDILIETYYFDNIQITTKIQSIDKTIKVLRDKIEKLETKQTERVDKK
jgi:septation ring formation regulator EzrA